MMRAAATDQEALEISFTALRLRSEAAEARQRRPPDYLAHGLE
jgi:hypothetical protein